MGDRVWAGAPEPQPSPAEGAKILAKVLLPLPGEFSPPAVHAWPLLMDRARELAAIHETRTRLIIVPDVWDLPWAIIYADPTGARP